MFSHVSVCLCVGVLRTRTWNRAPDFMRVATIKENISVINNLSDPTSRGTIPLRGSVFAPHATVTRYLRWDLGARQANLQILSKWYTANNRRCTRAIYCDLFLSSFRMRLVNHWCAFIDGRSCRTPPCVLPIVLAKKKKKKTITRSFQEIQRINHQYAMNNDVWSRHLSGVVNQWSIVLSCDWRIS